MKPISRIILFITIGITVGVGLGLFVGWVVWPVEFSDATVSMLDDSYQHDYALMVAESYAVDGNLIAAQQRLQRLNSADPNGWLLAFTVDQILSGANERDIRFLVKLATDLGLESPAMTPYLPEVSNDGG